MSEGQAGMLALCGLCCTPAAAGLALGWWLAVKRPWERVQRWITERLER